MAQSLTPMPQRWMIPQLPADIPIMPGEIKAAKAVRLPVGLMLFFLLVVLGVLLRMAVSYSDYDKHQIDPVVTRVMVAHVAKKGMLLPVWLRGGARNLQIVRADVKYQGLIPTTCVYVKVLDPKTGAQDPKAIGELTCIEGLKYPIH
jgi:hypothetical protein